MAISNCFYSPTSENLRGFPTWCVLAKLSSKTPVCRQAGATPEHSKLAKTTIKTSRFLFDILKK